ncbi:MAG: acetyltransferase [Curvibacter sp.]|jgi:sugar O-acyltransferase (sialic acid O-acetyltransferase NeuD family)|nr:acetyltransferase [Curvibacter sp.]
MKLLALLGASGHGKVVADAALAGGWDAVAFFDDAWPQRQSNGPWPVTGDSAALLARLREFQGVIVSIGDCALRWDKHQALQTAGAPMATVVHPAAVVSRHAVLGAGTVVMAGAVVNIDAVVGPAGIINTGATVDHDCCLGDAVHICPGAHLSGNVQVGHGSWVGVGAAVKQGMTIGKRVTVGAGAVVVHAIPDGLTVAGNPAVPLQTRKP